MFLINCIAFDAKWNKGYSDNSVFEDREFTNASGEKEKCTMLSSTESVYLHGDNACGFMKYYKGGRYSFAAVLPAEGISLSDYAGSLTGEKLTQLLDSRLTDQEVEVLMPEFKFDWGDSIEDQIKAIGLTAPFDKSADLSKMFKSVDGSTYLDQVIHKTHIELDRSGTKAAAVTSIDVKCDAVMETTYVYLDRPFLFMIVDNYNDLPIFIGALNSVSAE